MTNPYQNEMPVPSNWNDLIIVKVCRLHGLYAPILEADRCEDFCDSVALFATFAQFFEAIAPRNYVIF